LREGTPHTDNNTSAPGRSCWRWAPWKTRAHTPMDAFAPWPSELGRRARRRGAIGLEQKHLSSFNPPPSLQSGAWPLCEGEFFFVFWRERSLLVRAEPVCVGSGKNREPRSFALVCFLPVLAACVERWAKEGGIKILHFIFVHFCLFSPFPPSSLCAHKARYCREP
jgi:hypothetical protein